MAVPPLIVLFKLYGLYDRDVKRISHSTVDDLPWLFHATVIGVLLAWLVREVLPDGPTDFCARASCSARGDAHARDDRTLHAHATPDAADRPAEPALLVGGGEMAEAFVSKLAAHPE